jgi:hypothetical protein
MPGYGRVATSIERSRPSVERPPAERRRLDGHAHVGELAREHRHLIGAGALHDDFSAGEAGGREVCRRLYTVGHHPVRRGREIVARHPVDHESRRTHAFDVGAHPVQEVEQIGDLRLARRVVEHAGALGEYRRQHDVLGGAHAREGERSQPNSPPRGRDELVVATESGAEPESLQVYVDGPHAEVVTARHRHDGAAAASEQRSQDDDGRPHAPHRLVGHVGVQVLVDGNRDLVISDTRADLGTESAQKIAHDVDVEDARHVGEAMGTGREERRCHQLQHRVLRAGHSHGAAERSVGAHDDVIHWTTSMADGRITSRSAAPSAP